LLYQKINQRNVILLSAAAKGLTLEDVNCRLKERLMAVTTQLNWNVWVNFYLPLAYSDLGYERELIYNDRSLAWFAQDLKRRYHKNTIS